MDDRRNSRLIAVIVGLVVLIAVVGFAFSVYVGTSRHDRVEEAKRVKEEEGRLKTLELMEKMDKAMNQPSTLTDAEREELKQLRERAAKRKIERGY